MTKNFSLERPAASDEIPTTSHNDVSKLFEDAYQGGAKFLHDHPAAQVGIALGTAALAFRYARQNPLEFTKVIPRLEQDVVLMQSQRSGLRGLLGLSHEAPVIPTGMSVDVISTSKWFGLARESIYDMRTLKPIPFEGTTGIHELQLGQNFYKLVVGPGAEAPLSKIPRF